MQTKSSLKPALFGLLLFATAPTQAAETSVPDFGSNYELSATFVEHEAFGAALELWSPHLGKSGYWQTGRVGGGVMLHSFSENDPTGKEDNKRHVKNMDYMLGYAMDSRSSAVRFRSVFLAGHATLDRHAEFPGVDQSKKSYNFFDTRHGFNLIPPTHEASGGENGSLLELGVGFRWNFIGPAKVVAAGDTEIREMQVYPYLAANMEM